MLNLHAKTNSKVEDYHITYILFKDTITTRCGMLIVLLEMSVENGSMEITQSQHLGYNTSIWVTYTCYINKKLFT